MRNPQRPAPDSHPFLVLEISKRAALFLSLGLIAFAAAIVLRPSQMTARKAEDDAAHASAPSPASLTPAPQDAQEVYSDNAPPMAAALPTPPQGTTGAPAIEPTPAPAPPREPVPVRAVTHRLTVDDPGEPQTAPAPPSASDPDPSPASQPDANNSAPLASGPEPQPSSPALANSPFLVTGAGSPSPYPLYSKWFEAFHESHPDVQFSYQPVGSGAGLKQFLDGIVSFGAVDAPLTDQQLKLARSPIVHVPSVIGGVVMVYNLPGIGYLRLTPRVLAAIFLGKITSWNDPQVAAYNPAVTRLPAMPITVIHRSDACASTQILSDYLSKVSGEWQHQIGEGSSINWPLGLGAKGNEGVSQLLRRYSGAITYVDFQFAKANQMQSASLQNRSGHFVDADLRSLSVAAASSEIPDDFRVWITNAPGSDAYPIASFLWFLAPEHSGADAGTRDFADFLRWTTLSRSQSLAARLGYVPLPQELLDRVNQAISRIY